MQQQETIERIENAKSKHNRNMKSQKNNNLLKVLGRGSLIFPIPIPISLCHRDQDQSHFLLCPLSPRGTAGCKNTTRPNHV